MRHKLVPSKLLDVLSDMGGKVGQRRFLMENISLVCRRRARSAVWGNWCEDRLVNLVTGKGSDACGILCFTSQHVIALQRLSTF